MITILADTEHWTEAKPGGSTDLKQFVVLLFGWLGFLKSYNKALSQLGFLGYGRFPKGKYTKHHHFTKPAKSS